MNRVGLALVAGVLVLGVGGLGVSRWRGDDEPPPPPRACTHAEDERRDLLADEAYIRGWSDRLSQPTDGSTVVLADAPRGEPWRYREVVLPLHEEKLRGNPSRYVVEGVVNGEALDERHIFGITNVSRGTATRRVIVGTDIWSDEKRFDEWRHCRAEAFPDGPTLAFDYRYDPDDPTNDQCEPAECLLRLYPGTRVPVADPRVETVGGERLTTYEIVRFTEGRLKDPNRLRATMTVDDGRRLRAVKVWDTTTGQVYATFEAGPAPDHPPITDPSDEPRPSQQPVPPPPDLGTMPPGTRPPT